MLIRRADSRILSRVGPAGLGGYSAAPAFARTGNAWDTYNGLLTAGGPAGARYPLIAGRQGFLPEEADTNLWLNSDHIGNASTTKTAASTTANASTAPDSTVTMDKLVEDGTNAAHTCSQAALVTVGAKASVSFVTKPGERTFVYGQIGTGVTAYFNLGNGTVGTTVGASATITPLPNGSYLCRIVSTGNITVNGNVVLGLASADNTPSYQGDGASGAYFWRVMASTKLYCTSGIPTAGATVTRNAETLSLALPNSLNRKEGAIIIPFYADGDVALASSAAAHVLLDTAGTAGVDRFLLYRNATSNTWTCNFGGTTSLAGNKTLATGVHTLAVRWAAHKGAISIDGVELVATANPNLFAASKPTLFIGCDQTGAQQFDSTIFGLHLFDRWVPDQAFAFYTDQLAVYGDIPLTRDHALKLTFPGRMKLQQRGLSFQAERAEGFYTLTSRKRGHHR